MTRRSEAAPRYNLLPTADPASEPRGRLVAIAVREAPRRPMRTVDAGEVTTEAGLVDDSRGEHSERQLTLLEREAWEEVVAELGEPLEWTVRRANLLVEGVALAGTGGRRLAIGEVVVEVTGETRPCRRVEVHPGLREALGAGGRGGVTCRVIRGGRLAMGDPVEWVDDG